jgi:tetratricopeptide (TPR) repeat protein
VGGAVRLLIILAVGTYAGLAVQVYRVSTAEYGLDSYPSETAGIIGPRAALLIDGARDRSRAALDALNDTSMTPSERLATFRRQLESVEGLLLGALRVQPARAGALAHLAAARWELRPTIDEQGVKDQLAIVQLASRMAPTVPRVQIQLGTLLLKMGRSSEALAFFSRSIELDPPQSKSIVDILEAAMVPPSTMLEQLHRCPELLVALEGPFTRAGSTEQYLEQLERVFDESTDWARPAILARYANSALTLGQPSRLLEQLDRLGQLDDPLGEAARRLQRSRAFLALGQEEAAVEDAELASRLRLDDPSYSEHLGETLRRAGDPERAIEEFRRTLRLLALEGGSRAERARVYRRMGQAQEQRGEAAQAFDAYKLAAELSDQEEVAIRRVREMKASAGVTDP